MGRVDTGVVAAKPRILNDHKDLLWSLIPLVAICLLIAMVSGNCSVGLTGGAGDDKTPAYNVRDGLSADAASVGFPLRLPATPQDWKPNSGSRAGIDGHTVSNTGYLTSAGDYIQLSQTDATEDSLVGYLDDDQPIGRGVTTVAGRQWVRYATADDKSIWAADLGDVRIGLFSKADEPAFTTLAAAVLAGTVLPSAGQRPAPVG